MTLQQVAKHGDVTLNVEETGVRGNCFSEHLGRRRPRLLGWCDNQDQFFIAAGSSFP